jgi:Protein of unknown function (DUF4089)
MDNVVMTAYVDAACAAQGLTLSADRREAVLLQFARVAQIAETFLDFPLGAEDEQAPVYRP